MTFVLWRRHRSGATRIAAFDTREAAVAAARDTYKAARGALEVWHGQALVFAIKHKPRSLGPTVTVDVEP
jgi:hypothetical protein